MSLYRRGGKRAFDLIVAVPLLVLSCPVLLVVAVLVRIKLGSPVLFAQKRPGREGRVFQIHKFRTMTQVRDTAGHLLPDEARLTRFGAWLRSSSADELPELWNVIRGDMSLVGPRPLLVTYLDRYTSEQARRHEARPGITGWSQVNGRNNAPWPERLAMDVWYVDNYSLALDMRILWRTVWSVVKRSDVSEHGHATAQEFTGAEPGSIG